MHILLIPSWYATNNDPVSGVFFREQAHALRDHGDKVGVLVTPTLTSKRNLTSARKPADLGAKITVEDDDGIPTYRATHIGWFPGFFPRGNQRLLANISLRLFECYCKEYGQPNVLHAHSIIYGGYLAAYIGKRRGIPVVLTEHSSTLLRDMVQPYKVPIIQETLTRVDHCLAVSQPLANALCDYAPDKSIEVLGNIVDTDFFAAEPPPRSNRFTFCAVAKLTENKGLDILLRAFAELLQQARNPARSPGPDYSSPVLHLGGDGPARAALEQLVENLGIAKQVRFHGQLTRKEVRALIQASHVVVSSSYVETFGVTLIEALACGKPVVATRSGGPESFVNQSNGLLVATGDASALATAMQQMIATYLLYEPVSIRADCVAKFGTEAIVRRLQEIYQEVAYS